MGTKRRLKNYLLNSPAQKRFIVLMSTICVDIYLVAVVLIITALAYRVEKVAEEFANAPGMQTKVFSILLNSIGPIIGIGLVLTLMVAFFAMIVSHRIYGPLVPISKFLQEIKSGNYSARVAVRKEDQLQDLVTQLNEVAEALEARHNENRRA